MCRVCVDGGERRRVYGRACVHGADKSGVTPIHLLAVDVAVGQHDGRVGVVHLITRYRADDGGMRVVRDGQRAGKRFKVGLTGLGWARAQGGGVRNVRKRNLCTPQKFPPSCQTHGTGGVALVRLAAAVRLQGAQARLHDLLKRGGRIEAVQVANAFPEGRCQPLPAAVLHKKLQRERGWMLNACERKRVS